MNQKIFLLLFSLTLIYGCIPYRKLPELHSVSLPVHSHNDYAQKHPLYDALKNGVSSVEVDFYHLLGPLWVCHTPFGIVKMRGIKAWYLKPLKKIIRHNGGFVYTSGETFHILFESKTKTKNAMPRLKRILSQYSDILTKYTDRSTEIRPVTITILGERDDAFWMQDSVRYFGVELPFDENITGLNLNVYTQFRLSAGNPGKDGKLSPVLTGEIKDVLAKGQRIRANAGDDNERSWEALYETGVTFIHTDKLYELREYMMKRLKAR